MFIFLWGKKIEILIENTIQNNMGKFKEYLKESIKTTLIQT